MDRISVSHVVQDRTDELQRTADQVRLERSLRSKPIAETAATAVPEAQPARSAEAIPRVQSAALGPAAIEPAPAAARPSPGTAADCASAEHAA
jgi:hypothetical protein